MKKQKINSKQPIVKTFLFKGQTSLCKEVCLLPRTLSIPAIHKTCYRPIFLVLLDGFGPLACSSSELILKS
jgi:hypothetical protein